MKLGLLARFGDEGSNDIGYMREFAQAVEEAGFSSLLMPEHTVFFSQYESKYPYHPEGKPPFDEKISLFDPMFVMVALAQVTSTLRFCTSVLVLPQRPILLTAKEVMTVDHLTCGRFDFGIGGGWSREEYEALGTSFERRGKRFDEYIHAMRRVWSEDPASFDGEFVNFRNVVLLPRPFTPGGPPLLIGGDSDAAMKRAATLGNGWYGWPKDVDLEPHLAKLRTYLDDAGRRDDASFQLRIGFPFRDGTPDDLARRTEEAVQLGVTEMTAAIPIRRSHFEADIRSWAAAAGLS